MRAMGLKLSKYIKSTDLCQMHKQNLCDSFPNSNKQQFAW
jgi:hypothetical protein